MSGWEERWAGPRLKGLIAQKLGPNKGLNAAGILYLDILSCIPHHSSNPKPQPSEMLLSLIVHISTQKGLDWPILVLVLILALISESKGIEYGDPPDQGVWFVT